MAVSQVKLGVMEGAGHNRCMECSGREIASHVRTVVISGEISIPGSGKQYLAAIEENFFHCAIRQIPGTVHVKKFAHSVFQ